MRLKKSDSAKLFRLIRGRFLPQTTYKKRRPSQSEIQNESLLLDYKFTAIDDSTHRSHLPWATPTFFAYQKRRQEHHSGSLLPSEEYNFFSS